MKIKKAIFANDFVLALLFTLVGGFLRIYRLEELMTYLGDEGRDMLIVMDIIKGRNFPLIGPPTSIGALYLGPIYYYFIAPFAFIFKMSPVGPAFFVSLLGTLTIFLFYLVSKNFFGKTAAFFGTAFYTVSPLIVRFSRSSWNPNPMPFFVLLLVFSLFYWQKNKKPKFFYLSILSFGIMLQLHYMVIILVPYLIYVFYKLTRDCQNKKIVLYGLVIFLIFLSPLAVFDLRHNFLNIRGIIEILNNRTSEGFNFWDFISRSRDRVRQLFSLFFGFSEREAKNNLLVIINIGFLIFDWFKNKNKKIANLLIYGWFGWGIFLLGFYRQSVYPHYLGFLFPFPALFCGNLLANIFEKKKWGKVLSLVLFFTLFLNMVKITIKDLTKPSVLNVKVVKKIVDLIKRESEEKSFNFALLAKNNYDASYRYFFKLENLPVRYENEVTNQLFVVCEDEEVCKPEGNPKWEIAVFDAAYNGKIKRAGEWHPDPLIKVIKFVPQDNNEK